MCQFVNDGQSGLYLNDMFDDMDLYPTWYLLIINDNHDNIIIYPHCSLIIAFIGHKPLYLKSR
jgi:hypothetical protein